VVKRDNCNYVSQKADENQPPPFKEPSRRANTIAFIRLTALAVDGSPLFVQMCITITTSTGTLILPRRDVWHDLFLMTLRMMFRGCAQMRELLLSSRMEEV
jgi:hypothetical protein